MTTESETNGQNSPQKFITGEDDITRLIDVLLAERSTMMPWIRSKEAASWSALLFYFVMVGASLNFLLDDKCNIRIEDSFLKLLILLVPFFLWYIFFRFIHSHFQESRYVGSRDNAIRDTIIELIHLKEKFFIDKKISNKEDLFKHINSVTIDIFENWFKQKGKPHPLIIVIKLWLGWIKMIFHKKYDRLTNHERQEASIFSLLIFTTFLIEIFLFQILI